MESLRACVFQSGANIRMLCVKGLQNLLPEFLRILHIRRLLFGDVMDCSGGACLENLGLDIWHFELLKTLGLVGLVRRYIACFFIDEFTHERRMEGVFLVFNEEDIIDAAACLAFCLVC